MKITIIFDSGKVTKLTFNTVEIFELNYNKDDKTGLNKRITTRMYSKSNDDIKIIELANYIMWAIHESENKFVQFINNTESSNSVFVLKPTDRVASFELS